MSTNSELLTAGFRITLNTLVPYIISELRTEYADSWWNQGIYSRLYQDQQQNRPQYGSDDDLKKEFDVALALKAIDLNWGLFKRKVCKEFRSWTNETIQFRNEWAHQNSEEFSDSRTARALETMALMCGQIDSIAESELQKLVRTARYGSEHGSVAAVPQKKVVVVKKTQPSEPTNKTLKNWRNVMAPHPDVAEGRYKNAEFAADLSQVARGVASYEYLDPIEFFSRTYITEGMQTLLVQALQRITGKGGEPVVELKTAFGGGKTHSMLALYHMLGGKINIEAFPTLRPIIEKAGLTALPQAKIAVLVGTALNPAMSRRPSDMPGITVNTLWGEMAYQLARAAHDPSLYDLVKEADKKGVNPGSETLAQLFNRCGSCLILIDELVAYGRTLVGKDKENLPAGTFANFLSFLQALTEAACESPRCIVVSSIPESDIEIGGEDGQRVLKTLEHLFGRKEAIWKPVASSESFEVVRRRLFLKCSDEVARDAVCEAFSNMYHQQSKYFPLPCKEQDYLDRMKDCYPIHPEVFERLYEDWSTLEKFQRTRGVLRLMAAVINNLWMNNDQNLLIMPSSIPVGAPVIKEELLRYLPGDAWNTIVDTEVDGEKSIPYQIEKENQRLGRNQAVRKVTRTLFFGSAPSEGTQNRGLEKSHIFLGCVQPEEEISHYQDSLTYLLQKLSYLYVSNTNDRYWYDTRPTLRKLMEERANRISKESAQEEIIRQLRTIPNGRIFSSVHICPTNSLDIPDDMQARVVILPPTVSYSANSSDDGPALSMVNDYLRNRGAMSRQYKNMLVFMFADTELLSETLSICKKYLAWQSIDAEKETLQLSTIDKKDVNNGVQISKNALKEKLNRAYCWMIEPHIDLKTAPTDIILEPQQLSGEGNLILQLEKKMQQDETIVSILSPSVLLMDLDEILWKNKDCIEVRELWKDYCSYCYLRRLCNYQVVEDAIRKGLQSEDYFGFSEGRKSDGTYVGVTLGREHFSFDKSSVLIKSDVAKRLLASEAGFQQDDPDLFGTKPDQIPLSPTPGPGNPFGIRPFDNSSATSTMISPDNQSERNTPTTFYLTTDLDPVRAGRDIGKIMEEIIGPIQEIKGARYTIKVEVQAEFPKGQATSGKCRTINENCKTLKIEDYGFD